MRGKAMNTSTARANRKAIDHLQAYLTNYAHAMDFGALPADVVHAAKVRLIDTLGVLIGGYDGEPCRLSRDFAALYPDTRGATVIGTRWKASVDVAAFANATMARYSELSDSYHWPGSAQGHASDVVAPILAVAEHVGASGPELIAAIVLGYEIFCRISDVFHNPGFDTTNFESIAVAAAAGRLLALTDEQLAHCISMAAVSAGTLMQVRIGHLSMFKAVAAGQAGRAGIFAALLAWTGMQGPHLPFLGSSGWCDHVAKERFALRDFGGDGGTFKILETRIKHRAAAGTLIAAILAAELVAPLASVCDVDRVIVEVFERARRLNASGPQHWNPDTRESADHSAPYVVAATLMDGTITLRSFDDTHLRSAGLRALMQKVEIVVNDEYTRAYERLPQEHHTRVTVILKNGDRRVGVAGGGSDDQANQRSDAQLEGKFKSLCEASLGADRVRSLLDQLWALERMANVADIPAAFAFDGSC
jgi:2-methylcitrate dehydratase